MLSTALGTLSRPLRLSLRATWFTMLGGILVYTFLAWTILAFGKAKIGLTHFDPGWIGIGAALSLGAVALSLYLQNRFRSRKQLDALMHGTVSCADMARDSFNRINLRDLRTLHRLSDEELALARLLEPYRKHLMLRMSLGELVAVLGFLLALASGNLLLSAPFSLCAIMMLVSAWPNFDKELERARQTVLDTSAPLQAAS